ncbi:MAG: hypothetical protein VB862_05830, partial [Pirellulaceae bacterium]
LLLHLLKQLVDTFSRCDICLHQGRIDTRLTVLLQRLLGTLLVITLINRYLGTRLSQCQSDRFTQTRTITRNQCHAACQRKRQAPSPCLLRPYCRHT